MKNNVFKRCFGSRFSTLRSSIGLLNLFLFLMIGVLSVYSQPPEENLSALLIKSKPGLIKLNNILAYGEPNPFGAAALAFDNSYAYVATPNGLFRTPLPLTSANQFENLCFCSLPE